MTGITGRWYRGDEAQTADPLSQRRWAPQHPAYRGTAYVVFEELPLSTYGNRLPRLSFEVFRSLAEPDAAEGLVKAVTMIPASGEFTYATEAVRKTVGATTTVRGETTGGTTSAENLNAVPDAADIVVALDRLQAMAPAVESVSVVVARFGNDLRAGNCTIKPGMEVATKATSPKVWSVNSVAQANNCPSGQPGSPAEPLVRVRQATRTVRSTAARPRISRWCRPSARRRRAGCASPSIPSC